MAFELIGKLLVKYDTVQIKETFKKREFVLEIAQENGGRTFTDYAKFQCIQDRTSIVDRVNVGDTIKVHFNIKGSRWEKNGTVNYITNLEAWRIEQILQPGGNAPSDSDHLEPLDTFSATPPDAVDDLPF